MLHEVRKRFHADSPPILAHALLRVTSNYSRVLVRSVGQLTRPIEVLKKIFQQVERNSQAVIPRRAQIIDGRNLCRERSLGGGQTLGVDWFVPECTFGLHAPQGNRRHTAERDANFDDAIIYYAPDGGEASFRNGLGLARTDLSIVMRQLLRGPRQADPAQ